MNDPALVSRFQRFRNLPGHAQRFIDRHRAALQPFLKRFTVHILHDNATRVVRFFEPVDLSDVRVVQ